MAEFLADAKCIVANNLHNEFIGNFKEVMILSVKNPGFSGQEFNENSFDLIDRIDKKKDRKKLKVLVDGGVNSKLIKKINIFM